MADDHDDNHKFRPNGINEKKYELNSKIMLTAIISLTVVVILVLLLHIYARYALRRQARRRALMRHLGLSAIIQDQSSSEPPKTGLDPSVIASLPSFVFKQSEAKGGTIDDATAIIECAVCLSTLEDEEMARLLPNCNHTFHAECIDKWLSSHSTCPICRTDAKPSLRAEPREPPARATAPTAPLLERGNSTSSSWREGTTSGGGAGPSSLAKVSGGSSSSRFGSFRRILTRERSSRRIQPSETDLENLERQ